MSVHTACHPLEVDEELLDSLMIGVKKIHSAQQVWSSIANEIETVHGRLWIVKEPDTLRAFQASKLLLTLVSQDLEECPCGDEIDTLRSGIVTWMQHDRTPSGPIEAVVVDGSVINLQTIERLATAGFTDHLVVAFHHTTPDTLVEDLGSLDLVGTPQYTRIQTLQLSYMTHNEEGNCLSYNDIYSVHDPDGFRRSNHPFEAVVEEFDAAQVSISRQLNDVQLLQFVSAQRNLEHFALRFPLAVYSLVSLTDVVRVLRTLPPGLRSLQLGGCHISKKDLLELLDGHRALEALDLSQCWLVTEAEKTEKNLKSMLGDTAAEIRLWNRSVYDCFESLITRRRWDYLRFSSSHPANASGMDLSVVRGHVTRMQWWSLSPEMSRRVRQLCEEINDDDQDKWNGLFEDLCKHMEIARDMAEGRGLYGGGRRQFSVKVWDNIEYFETCCDYWRTFITMWIPSGLI